ncbi:hypothetical protein DFH08DRAFT_844947 [Mycena albidolilacea]|uniref:RING-type domain-containing protein n=1 Tax=Mycena albidolilacea TaxID=1033008 RepID=A0AAD7EYU0_9AGAR|nr:hypothetical protein DFH08DRAFT_844947 [Mycena albidolilacea]
MLSIGPCSTCGVCLEPFGPQLKAPCSIPCGHVFCVNCLTPVTDLTRHNCPLCRSPFDEQDIVRLHVDDSDTLPFPSHDDEARRLLTEIAAVNNVTTERRTIEVIEECKKFLRNAPENTVGPF